MADIDLATVPEVRRFLQKPTADVNQDQIISELITRASRAIMTYLGREILPTQVASHAFIYRGGRRLNLAPYVVQSVTSVVMDTDTTSPSTLATSEFSLRPMPARNGVYRWLRIPYGGNQWVGPDIPGEREFAQREVTVTGLWGYSEVPEDVKHWCIVTVAEWMRLHVQAFSTVLNIDTGQLERPESLPSAVRAGLRHYRSVPVP